MAIVKKGRVVVHAGCHDCGKFWNSANGFGVAAQHADRYGHNTWVDKTNHYDISPQ